MKVIARPGESIDNLIRRFHGTLLHDGFYEELDEMKKNYYQKPSEIRHLKEQARLRKIREANRKYKKPYDQ